jgi:hypothetical protein
MRKDDAGAWVLEPVEVHRVATSAFRCLPRASAAHLLERTNIKLAVREHREVDLLADRSRPSLLQG